MPEHFGILGSRSIQELVHGVVERGVHKRLWHDIRLICGPVQRLPHLGLENADLLLVCGRVAQNFRLLQLRLEHILLITLSDPVTRFGDFRDLFKQFSVMRQDLQFLPLVSEHEIRGLHLFNHRPPNRLIMLARNGDVPFCHLAAQAQLSRIRKVLRDSESDVSEIAIRISGERTRAADRELLHHDFRVRKRRNL